MVSLHNDDALNVLPTIPTASMDLVIADPPYLLNVGSNGNVGGKVGTWADITNAAYWYSTWYKECWRTLAPTGTFWSFCNWRSLPVVQKALFDAGMPLTSLVVWDKDWIGPAPLWALRPTYELIAMAAKPKSRILNRSLSDIWRCRWMAVHSGTHHPAEKPQRIIEMILDAAGIASGAILDPFTGSGPVGIVAVRRKIGYVGIELDQRYFEIAKSLIAASGAQPTLPIDIPPAPAEQLTFDDDSR